jgi:hypothetical protein
MMMAMMIQRHRATTIVEMIVVVATIALIAMTEAVGVIATVIATVIVVHAKSASQLLAKMMF